MVQHVFLLIIVSLEALGCFCEYTKVQYITQYSPITSVVNCKINSNAIFTTMSKLVHWTSYQKINQYQLAYNAKPPFYLACSKYANRLDHAYFVVHDIDGRVYLWQEVVKAFSVYLDDKGQMSTRDSPVTSVAVDLNYVALGYNNLKIIDIVEVDSNQPPVTLLIKPTQNILALNLDTQGNLAALLEQNGKISFTYYISPYKSANQTLETQFSMQILPPYSIDYQQQDHSFRFLVSSSIQSGYITFDIESQQISPFVLIGNFSQARLCDGDLTYVESSTIQKQQSGNIISLANPINLFTCSTDTGSYVFSEFYIVTNKGDQFFIDCYYNANNVLGYIIEFAFICCCCCCRLCARGQCSGLCRQFRKLFKIIFSIFCWCPTQQSIEEIEDALKR